MCDSDKADDLDVKKDTFRIQEIKAMKKAWEQMDPGRATKV